MFSSTLNTTDIGNSSTTTKHLFSTGWDFLLLGGGSLIALLALKLILGREDLAFAFTATLALAHIINHPHFAHSYQIFYRNFGEKITKYPADLRWRYMVSGTVIPVALIGLFGVTVILQSPKALGLGANLMFFLVGWHYVKQGYGMAMVDAVLKRAFYSNEEKRILLSNAYATWIFSWLLINHGAGSSTSQYWDIPYFSVPVPLPIVFIAGGICAYTSVRLCFTLRNRLRTNQPLAWNGVIAYAASLYAWLLIRDPLVLLWIPFFHSLQYMSVVWRQEINRSHSVPSSIRPTLRLAFFAVSAYGLGYIGFWALPEWLNANIDYPKDLFGESLFFYLFWIFINVHHYFLDTVMWRKGNPDVQAHLFSH